MLRAPEFQTDPLPVTVTRPSPVPDREFLDSSALALVTEPPFSMVSRPVPPLVVPVGPMPIERPPPIIQREPAPVTSTLPVPPDVPINAPPVLVNAPPP